MMDINFPLVLVIITAITGIFTLYYKIRKNKLKADYKPNSFIDFCRSTFPVLFIVMIIRSFIVEPYKIPSGSMIPTLKIGDFILVNKFNYGLRLPVIGTNIYNVGAPKFGDVMVFKQPGKESINFIKRVIGVPGDIISYVNKKFYINGVAIDKDLLNNTTDIATNFSLFNECIGDNCHYIQTNNNKFNLAAEGTWKVPANMYFVAGDNRDNSHDSRFWGFVPDKNIVGKAFYIWMNWQGFTNLPTFSNNGIIR
jgi:signal peptidase I